MNIPIQNRSMVLIDLDKRSFHNIDMILGDMTNISVITESQDLGNSISLIRQCKPDIVLLNLYPSVEQVLEVARRITQTFPEITLFVTASEVNPDVILSAMRSGAREFFPQPVKKEELIRAIQKITHAPHQSAKEKSSDSKVLTMFGTKGGVGTTTIAINTASLLAQHTEKDVVVIDLNLQFGSTALFMDVKPKHSILDVAKNLDHIDLNLLKSMLPKGSDNVYLLSGPGKIEEAEKISAEHIERILILMQSIFDYIIIDTPPVLNDITIKAMDVSNFVLMISSMEIPAVYNAKRCLKLFQEMGYDQKKLKLVINHCNQSEDADMDAMEKLLDYTIFWQLPHHDVKSILKAVSKGIPISQMMPGCKLSQSFLKMIQNFNGTLSSKTIQVKKPQKVKFLNKIMN